MFDIKHCSGCYNNYYNSKSTSGSSDGMCWSRKSAKLVWRIIIGIDEPPPYKNKAKRVPNCWRGRRICAIKKESLTKEGYWKSF